LNGAEILAIKPGSNAERLGLQPGDRITYLNQYRLQNYSRFLGFMGTYPARTPVNLTYVRGTTAKTLQIPLDPYNPGSLGVKFRTPKTITDPLVIDYVYPRLAGERAGLKVGDALVSINGKSVGTYIEYYIAQQGQQFLAGDAMKIKVRRQFGPRAEEREFNVTLSSAYDVPPERRVVPRR
jgi:S1-C subfamily serine protease